jgi:hypothetical protein
MFLLATFRFTLLCMGPGFAIKHFLISLCYGVLYVLSLEKSLRYDCSSFPCQNFLPDSCILFNPVIYGKKISLFSIQTS